MSITSTGLRKNDIESKCKTLGPADMATSPTASFGKVKGYRVLEEIGKGTYGTVYKVESTKLSALEERGTAKTYNALKKIDISTLNRKEKENIEREQDTMKSYQHKHIVQYHESFSEGQYLYIVMEYCEGGTLYHFMKRRGAGLEEKQFVNYLQQIMEGVRYLHSQDIIHRDLKTKNILLTGDSIIKIADFGVARSIDTHVSELSVFVGTVHFMSPEMISRKQNYTTKTDIWSVGCTCYEIGTANYAFDGKNVPRIKQAICEGKLYDVDKIKFCEAMKELILSMLQPDPENRPSAEEILSTLTKHTCANSDQRAETPSVLSPLSSLTSPRTSTPREKQDPLGESESERKEIRDRLSLSLSDRRSTSFDKGLISPRHRRRTHSENMDESGTSSFSSSTVSTCSSRSQDSGVSVKGPRSVVMRGYKKLSKALQLELAAQFDNYRALEQVAKIKKWCRECSTEELETKTKQMLRKKPNLFVATRRMVRSLMEIEVGIMEEKERTKHPEARTDDDDDDESSLDSSTSSILTIS